MKSIRDIHPDFLHLLQFKDQHVIKLFLDVRTYILEINPECNELV